MSDITNGIETGQQPEELGTEALEQAVGGATATSAPATISSATKADESPKETTTFEYGGLVIRYGQQ